MTTSLHTVLTLSILMLFFTIQTKAQPRKGEFIDVSAGLGLSAPYDDVDIFGSGFYTQGEYVFGFTKWFGVRPYAGLILTAADSSPEQPELAGYKVTANAFLLGGKIRLSAPIPWVAPYFELGIGASIGSFETYTPITDMQESGLLLHIPYSIGLALGRKHKFEVAFTYYEHPAVDQYAGAVAFGFSFPLR